MKCESFVNKRNDVWSTCNRLQENIINGGLRGPKIGANGRRRKATTRPVKALDKKLKLNQALWVLTQEMGKRAKEIA